MYDARGTWAYFSDTAQHLFTITTGSWPSATPTSTTTSTVRPGCQLRGKLTVIPFFEQGRFGVEVSLCLTNAGSTRINLLQILNTIQGSSLGGDFSGLLSEYLDLSAKPYLDPGEEHCYTARFFFNPLEGGHYRDEIHVFAVGEMDAPSSKVPAQPSADFTGDPAAELATLELIADFSLPESSDPSLTPSITATPTVTGTITQTVTATLTETPTTTATEMPFLGSPYPTYTEVVSTATPYPTYTDVPPSPTPFPTDTPEPAPTETPPPPTDAPTTEPTAAEVTPTAG
ncbi:MAG: hypothetical protein PHQ40_20610 [Anaerolineaceae bacterium]|nr:hypothetical protein [Anaerolineaceae bacterium]